MARRREGQGAVGILTVPLPDGREVPHWVLKADRDHWDAFEDFQVFLKAVWHHLGLPDPTEGQLAIAERMQNPHVNAEGGAADVIRCPRGFGKSYIAAAFVLWRLARNPRDEKVLVVSATGNKSKDFVQQVRTVLKTMPMLEFLRPDRDTRDTTLAFDVKGASISQSHSVKCVGLTGQMTGSRASLIIADDVEIKGNSNTEEARHRLLAYWTEFDAIKIPGGDIFALGTPFTEESIYNRLVRERGYGCFCLPARWPEKVSSYLMKTEDGEEVQILAPYLLERAEAGLLKPGQPTDPQRFDDAFLRAREGKNGRTWFALQYLLDPAPGDALRYPLRQIDIPVFEASPMAAPVSVSWGRNADGGNILRDIPNLGFSGDVLMAPFRVAEEWRPYEASVLFVDTAGRGADETAWAVVKALKGMLWCLEVDGHRGDPAEAMMKVALAAKRLNVSKVLIEPNFAQGVWIEAFKPILRRVWPNGCAVEEAKWSTGRKEERILGVLEPIISGHRLAITESLVRRDARSALENVSDEGTSSRDYSLLYQLTHITKERKSLPHDDRIDALAGACADLLKHLGLDMAEAVAEGAREEREAAIDYFQNLLDCGGAIGAIRARPLRHASYRDGSARPYRVWDIEDDEDPNTWLPPWRRGQIIRRSRIS